MAIVAASVCALLVLVALLPPVQLGIVRFLTRDLTGAQLQIGGFSAGPWGLHIEDLAVTSEKLALTVAEGRIDLAFWASLSHLRIEIASATLSGIEVNQSSAIDSAFARSDDSEGPDAAAARNPDTVAGSDAEADAEAEADADADADAEAESVAWADRLRNLDAVAAWPAAIHVRQARADGQFVTTTTAGLDLRAQFDVALSDWRPGARATATLSGAAEARRGDAAVAALTFESLLGADIATDGPIERLDATLALTNAGDTRGLDAAFLAVLADDGQQYSLSIDTRAGARLATVTAGIDSAGIVTTEWNAELPPGVVAAFAQGRSTADLSGTSSGRVTLARSGTAAIELTGEAVGSGWGAVDPRLIDLGTLTFNISADAEIAGDVITARESAVSLGSATLGDLFIVDVLQPLRFDTGSWHADPETWGEPAVRVQLNEMPVRWLRQFDPSGRLLDGTVAFAFDLVRDEARVTRLAVTEPLRATGVALTPIGGVDVPVFDVTLSPQATLADGALSADIAELVISAETGLTVQFTGSGSASRESWPVAEFDGEITATVPALTRLVPALDHVRATAAIRFDFDSLEMALAGATAGAYTTDDAEILLADLSGQQPLRITLVPFLPDWDDFEPRSVTLALNQMPIDWLSAYFPEVELRSGAVSGRLVATSGGGRGLRLLAEEPLAIENLQPVYRGRTFALGVTSSMRPSLELTTAASEFRLDDLSFTSLNGDTLTGRLSIGAATGDDTIAVELELDGRFPTLEARTGARLGTLRVSQRGTLSRTTHRFAIAQFEFEISDAAGSDFLRIDNLQPFFVDANPFAVGSSGTEPDILRVAISPLRLERLLPSVLGFSLEGRLPEGEFRGRTEPGGGLAFAASEPLEFSDVTVRWENAALLERITMSADFEVFYSVNGFEARSIDLAALTPDGDVMLTASSEVVAPLSAESSWTRAALRSSASLPALVRQPILADLPEFTSGRFELDVASSNTETATFSLRAVLEGAATADSGILPEIGLGVEAQSVPGESVTLSIPLRLRSESAGDSDLSLDGVLDRSPDARDRLSANLTGSRLAWEDLARLAAVIAPEPAAADSLTTPDTVLSALEKLRTERHSEPLWPREFDVAASVAIGRIDFPSFAIEDLGGRLELSPELASFTDLHATMLDAALSARAEFGFDATTESPYSLDFEAAVDELDVGRLFRLVAPDAEPTTEGRFDLAASLTSRGRNPIDLGLSALGEIRLEGRDGIFRGLADFEGTGSSASRVIGTLTFSRELRALARLLEGLGEIHFEDAGIVLARETRERLEFERLSLTAPQIALQAQGTLALAPDRSLLLSPLELDTQIAARGDVAVLFDGMELLEPQSDDNADAFRPLIRAIGITGTPAQPDASDFWVLLGEGAENARGSFGFGLRALNRRLEANRATEQE